MKQYLKIIFQRYLLILFSLSFFFIALSPYFQSASSNMALKMAFALFIYRINMISIFSLLFATLTTIQTYENQNVNTAIAMSGMHSFRIIRPAIFFAIALSLLHLSINQFFLGTSIKILNKDFCLTDNNGNLHVRKLDGKYIFYTGELKNFTLIDENKKILYAKEGKITSTGIDLLYADLLEKKDGVYEKVSSLNSFHLEINPKSLLEEEICYNSDSLTKLYTFYKKYQHTPMQKIETTFFYRLLHPFLHLFAVCLGAIFAFSRFFRKRPYLCLFSCLFSSLIFLYLIEALFLLTEASIVYSTYFTGTVLTILCFSPLLLYVKKV